MNFGKILKTIGREVGKAILDGLLRRGEKRIGQQVKGMTKEPTK